MVKQGANKFRVMLGASLVALALASAPAKANHNHSVVAPVAAFIVLGALLHHSNHHHYNRHYRSHHNHYRHYRHHRHSYSQGGYHNPKRNHHKRW